MTSVACALHANANRDPKKRSDPFKPADFIPWHPDNRKPKDAVLLADPKAQADLIKQALFGRRK
jgi:hypothetical protein